MQASHALIIDDNALNIDVLIMLLTREGVTYTAVNAPRSLTATLDDLGRVDIVFLDLEFPNHHGFELLKTLKAHPLLAHTPIVAYTVHISEIDRARELGFDSFLGKPLNVQQFPEQLYHILRGQPVWEA